MFFVYYSPSLVTVASAADPSHSWLIHLNNNTATVTVLYQHKQFGIPPETIKDSMRLGIPVPQVYIVPLERFCRELGPALGVNLAEFEFPAYFNYFINKKRCTLVVDSVDAEDNIRRVFGETLLGPAQFRREENPITIEKEDFTPDFPREAMPNFQKEFLHFRIMPDGHELVIETLLDFRHFELRVGGDDDNNGLGVPPLLEEESTDDEEGSGSENVSGDETSEEVPVDLSGVENREKRTPWTYSNAAAMGKRDDDDDNVASLLCKILELTCSCIRFLSRIR